MKIIKSSDMQDENLDRGKLRTESLMKSDTSNMQGTEKLNERLFALERRLSEIQKKC